MSYRDDMRALGLTVAEADALQWALHLDSTCNAAACTGRILRKRTMRSLQEKGFVEEVVAVVVDGDGFHLEPERERIAYQLTAEGRKLAEKVRVVEVDAVYQILTGGVI